MSKQTFTAGQVLTAAEMNSLQENDYNWAVSTKTASYTLAAGDEGTRIVMDSASATTITVDDAIFSAGDVVWVHNIGAGTVTVTAGTATVNTTGGLGLALGQYAGGQLYFTSASAALFFPNEAGGTIPFADAAARTTAVPSPIEGQMSYLKDTNSVEVYDGSAWAAVGAGGGLVFVTSSTFSSVTSASIDNCFTSDYDNYLVTFTQTALASSTHDLRVRFREAGTTDSAVQYRNRIMTVSSSSTVNGTYLDASFLYFSKVDTSYRTFSTATVYGPNLASNTGWAGQGTGWSTGGALTFGSLNTTTSQYDGIHFYHATGGTFSGEFKIYGMVDS